MGMPFQPWRAALLPASFGGVGFKVETGGKSGGRRIAEHEYPKQDTPFGEDMGRKAHRWTITGYILGPNYLGPRDALIALCDSEGPYTLQHPSLGFEQVHCETYAVTESREKGGWCAFEFVFVEAGQDPGVSATADTQAQLTTAADNNSATAATTADQGVANSSSPSASSVGGIGSDTVATAKANAGGSYPTSAPSNVGSFDATSSTVG